MKKYLSILILSLLAVTACEEDLIVYDGASGQTLVNFASSSANLPVIVDATGSVDVAVNVSTVSDVDRTYTVNVVSEETTTSASNYSVGSLTIPAGAYNGTLTINGMDGDLETTSEKIVLALDNSSGDFVTDTPKLTINIYQICPSDLAGTYTSTTTGVSTDVCCPTETTVTGTVTLTAKGNGVYTISDWSAGLYYEWYAGYGIADGASYMNAEISDVCLVVEGSFEEPFGADTEVTGSVDLDTGIITYSWVNGYGDNAVVVLTPQ